MMDLYLRGLLIGVSVAAQVGPMSILCIKRTLGQGRLAGFVSGLGIASADGIYASIGGFGLTFISTFLIAQQFWLRLVGGLFLCYLGYQAWSSRPAEEAARAPRETRLAGLYFSTLLLSLTNPLTILSFAAILAGLGLGNTSGNYGAAALLIGGVFCGSALWWLVLTNGVNFFRAKITPRRLWWINRLAGLVIIAFGLFALVGLFTT